MSQTNTAAAKRRRTNEPTAEPTAEPATATAAAAKPLALLTGPSTEDVAKKARFRTALEASSEPRVIVVDQHSDDVSPSTAVLPLSLCTPELLESLDKACLCVLNTGDGAEYEKERESVDDALHALKKAHPQFWCGGVVALRGVVIERFYTLLTVD